MTEDRSVLTRPAGPPAETVAWGAQADQVADIRFGGDAAAARPLVCIVHGGFWRPEYDRLHTAPMAEALAASGWTVASLEYRRIPGNPDATLEDVGVALRKLPASVSRHNGSVIALGHSAGGHLALWAASHLGAGELAGAVALGAAADLQLAFDLGLGDGAAEAFLGGHPASRPDVDPCRMKSPTVPVTLIHGEEDEIVPVSLSESYARRHAAARLVKLPAAGHFALIDPLSDAWPVVIAEISRCSA